MLTEPNPTIAPGHSTPSQEGNGSGIDLIITVRDKDGQIIEQQTKEGDIYLKNWGLLLAAMFREAINPLYPDVYKGHNITGDTFNMNGWWGYSTISGSSYYTDWDDRFRVILGSSQIAPTIDDHYVGAFVAEARPGAPSMTNDGNVIKVIYTVTHSFESSVTLAEAATQICCPWQDNGTGAGIGATPFLITRDIFEPVTVPTGGSITIQFELWFNGMPVEA